MRYRLSWPSSTTRGLSFLHTVYPALLYSACAGLSWNLPPNKAWPNQHPFCLCCPLNEQGMQVAQCSIRNDRPAPSCASSLIMTGSSQPQIATDTHFDTCAFLYKHARPLE